jgi:hypothetical protein
MNCGVDRPKFGGGDPQKEMAEEEGLRPVLKWVKRLIDGVLIEDFGEADIEFAPMIYWRRGRTNRRRPAGAGADELRRRGNPDAQRSAGETGRSAGERPGGECAAGSDAKARRFAHALAGALPKSTRRDRTIGEPKAFSRSGEPLR